MVVCSSFVLIFFLFKNVPLIIHKVGYTTRTETQEIFGELSQKIAKNKLYFLFFYCFA